MDFKINKNIFNNLNVFFQCNIFSILRDHGICYSKNSKKILKYRNIYKGKRCFIIGNGPSLTADDLDLLKGEITFASNKIHLIYDKTDWRPTHFGVVDGTATERSWKEMLKHNKDYFTCNHSYQMIKKRVKGRDKEKVVCIRYNWYDQKVKGIGERRCHQKISGNMINYTYPILATVTCFLYEMAVYMGIKEIYFLGVDNNTFIKRKNNEINHFSDKYVRNFEKKIGEIRVAETLKQFGYKNMELLLQDTYVAIKKYSKSHGVKVYNATRGGNLDFFERVRLEDVLQKV